MSTENKFIKYLSPVYRGTCHDYRMFKEEFPPEKANWFRGLLVHLDSGFQGIEKDYPSMKVSIPKKKPRGKELTEKQKIENKSKSSQRIVIENAIGGMKRYRYVSDRLRARNLCRYSKIAGIAAGLWNFNLSN